MMTPLLELHGIHKRFGAVQALSDVRFEVRAGEVMALVGDNGAGKSTLIKIISGIYRADGGTIRWQGREVAIATPNDSTTLGIATVYQDLALCDNLDVVANLFLGREVAIPRGPLGVMDEVAMERRAVEVLRRLSVKIPSVRIPIASLSGGQRQSVAVARSVMGDNKVVMLDEPTAALGMAQTHEVLELIKRLRGQGLGVVLISHNLANVYEVADRITVLRLGRHVGTYEARSTTREQLIGFMTGAVPGGDELPTVSAGVTGARTEPA
ncbi:MAG: sugar ABC transporter ATP-binding protein [Deltaproteobacteria bacterium]|nr:MAG: sugar ABC transporter ATP-binding protein [Deltaproteobacteria bacterium]